MPLLQLEALEMKDDWNSHRIRLQKGKGRPCGVPNDLFELSTLKGLCLLSNLLKHNFINMKNTPFWSFTLHLSLNHCD